LTEDIESMSNPETTDKLISVLARQAFSVCFKEANLSILETLPTNVKTLMEVLELTKVPVNSHLNELEKAGLLSRDKGTGNVYPTKMGKEFLKMYKKSKKIIEKDLVFLFKKAIE